MKKTADAALERFRLIALLEGISYLVLLFIAMPLKYGADMPLPVKYTGWAHGVLFVLYLLLLVEVTVKMRWSLLTALFAFVASLVPFGTFVLDRQLLKKRKQA